MAQTQSNPNITNPNPSPPIRVSSPPIPQTEPLHPPNNEPVPTTVNHQIQTTTILNLHPMRTRSKNKIIKPSQKFSHLATAEKALTSEPTTITQALRDKEWRKAASSEIDTHIKNHTWDLVPASPGQNLVGCRLMFTTKKIAQR